MIKKIIGGVLAIIILVTFILLVFGKIEWLWFWIIVLVFGLIPSQILKRWNKSK